MLTQRTRAPSFCELLLHSGLSDRAARSLDFFMESAFDGVPLAGAHVLDVGAGEGFHSLYSLHAGAAGVVAVEPELAGARAGMARRLIERTNDLPGVAERFAFNPHLVQDLDGGIGGFDVVLCFSMINHVDEEAVHLRRLRAALVNRLAAYCLTSHFILYLRAV